MTKLDELRQAFSQVTPGEWELDGMGSETPEIVVDRGKKWDNPTVCSFYHDITPEDSVTMCPWYRPHENAQAHAAFIALAHNLMPQLLEAVVELGRFVEYLGVAGCDGAYDREIERAVNLLENLK